MAGKKFGFVLVGLLVAVAGGVACTAWALFQVPDFYSEAITEAPPPAKRELAAKELEQRTLQLVEEIQHADTWSEEFTQQHINSWLAAHLHTKYAGLVPRGVSEPRVLFDDGTVHLGFRYEDSKWKGIVSVEARPWIPEPNRLAVEIQSIRAGLVPIPLERVLEEISERFERKGWHTEWREHDGNDVIVLHFVAAEAGDPVLEAIEVDEGAVRVAGSRRADEATSGNSQAESDGASTVTRPPIHRLAIRKLDK